MFVKVKMTSHPFTVDAADPVTRAMEVMKTRRVRHLPVLHEGRVVGVLSHSDIAAAGPSRATTFSSGEVNYLLEKLKVSKVMTRDPITIGPDALLEEAAVLMRDNKIEMLPVVEGERLVGVITESAILDSFIDILGFRSPGTRLTIEAPDTPGTLERIGRITAEADANITHLAVYRGQGDRSVVVLGVNSLNTDEIEAECAAADMHVIAKLQNM